jgi:outer membrane immunogenic protein
MHLLNSKVERTGFKMKKYLFGLLAVAGLTGQALAADLPVRMPPPKAYYPWNNCYIGGNVGWGRARVHDYWLADPTGYSAAAVVSLNGASDGTLSSSGAIGGGQIGCNFQTSSWVVWGVEGDFDATSLKADRLVVSPTGALANIFTLDEQMKVSWVSTARVRVGTTFYSNWLVYATGGVAFANLTFNDCADHFGAAPAFCDTSDASGPAFNNVHFNQTKFGYAAGGGIEIPWNGWSIKAEYLFVGIPRITTLSQSTPFFTSEDIVHVHSNINVQTVRIGLNYHFWCCGPSSPMVVKAAY